MQRVAIALGSNLGDRRAALAFAADRLAALLDNPVLSDIIETDPVGEGLEDQPLYLNAALVGETSLDARRGHVAGALEQLVAVELAQELQHLCGFHELCFSLQVMQTRVHGMALSRADAIGSPQSRQMP